MHDWKLLAACRDHDPELFFPLPHSSDVEAARDVCAGCPVAAQCLADALHGGVDHGIYGGLTPDERRQLSPARTGR